MKQVRIQIEKTKELNPSSYGLWEFFVTEIKTFVHPQLAQQPLDVRLNSVWLAVIGETLDGLSKRHCN